MREIRLFDGTFVATGEGLKTVGSLVSGMKVSHNYSTAPQELEFLYQTEVTKAVAVDLADGNTAVLPCQAMVRARTFESAIFKHVLVEELTEQHLVLQTQRRLRLFTGTDDTLLNDFKFTRESQLSEILPASQAAFNTALLYRLEEVSPEDGIAHTHPRGLYLNCEDLWTARGLASLVKLHGINAELHPNTPIVYVDLNRPSCFVAKLSTGLFEGPAAEAVIGEFYGSEIFRTCAPVTAAFISAINKSGAVVEGEGLENVIPVLRSRSVLLGQATALSLFAIPDQAHVDTPWFQV